MPYARDTPPSTKSSAASTGKTPEPEPTPPLVPRVSPPLPQGRVPRNEAGGFRRCPLLPLAEGEAGDAVEAAEVLGLDKVQARDL